MKVFRLRNCSWVATLCMALSATLASSLHYNLFASFIVLDDDPAAKAPSQNKSQPTSLTRVELESLIAELEKRLAATPDASTRFNLAERHLQLAELVFDLDPKLAQDSWSRYFKLNDELCELISIINFQKAIQFKHVYQREGDATVVDPVQIAKRGQLLSEKLAKANDDPLQRQLIVIQGFRLLGTFEALSSQLDDAKSNLIRALETAAAALKQNPQSKEIRLQLAKGHHTLGFIYLRSSDIEQTIDSFQKAVEHSRTLATEEPKDREIGCLFARGLGETAALMQVLGKLPDAQKYAEEGVVVAEQLAENFPSQVALKLDLAAAHNRLGTILIKSQDLPAAKKHLDSALTIYDSNEPESAFASNEMAGSMVNLAVMFFQTDKAKEARELLIRAKPYHLKAIKAEPANGMFRFFFRNNRAVLMMSCVMLKNHSEAFATIEELLEYSESPQDTFLAAKTAAQCVDIAEADEGLTRDNAAAIQMKYTQTALSLLKELVQKGMIGKEHLADEQFKSLSANEEFKELTK